MNRLFALLLCCLAPTLLPAWGANGHRIVAHIAYQNLDAGAKARVDAAMGNNYLAYLSTWPDYIKAEKGWDFAKSWHYMTVQPDETIGEVDGKNRPNDRVDDVREGIELMTGVLKNDAAARRRLQSLMDENRVSPLNNSLDATALAFLIHFIGDVHQPMHVGKNRDLGGNKIAVEFFGERKNLHSVWDTQIIEHERLSYTEFADFASIHTRDRRAEWAADELETWISESIVLREKIYNTLYDRTNRESGLPDLSWDYQHDYLPVVEARLAAAGYRAAALLNGIYK